jgi:hypothetical protein
MCVGTAQTLNAALEGGVILMWILEKQGVKICDGVKW